MVAIATVNVNGVRAAMRKGMGQWLAAAAPDIVCLQEVRAPDEDLAAALPGWNILHDPCEIKGRAGVAIATKLPIMERRVGLGLPGPVNTGRWVEADVAIPTWEQPLTVVSAYVHVGELDTPKQADKHQFLAAMTERLRAWGGDGDKRCDASVGEVDRKAASVGVGALSPGRLVLVCGDINVAHTQLDIRNWRGNIGKRGFTEAERAHLTTWFDDLGWTDIGREMAGQVDGPYTWWSWRGRAYDNDAGWRIDYQIASPALAPRARSARVDQAPTWDTRWSDHSPLVVTYEE